METATPYVIPLSAQKPKILSLCPNDPTSRYKCRQLQVQIVGKSKMIKTVLVNILDVAKDMQVPPSCIVFTLMLCDDRCCGKGFGGLQQTDIGTFMGYEIGAQAKFDAAKPERQQAYISGEHATKDLSQILLQFITEVVLCPVCSLPELLLNFEQKNKVMGRCRACGGNSELPITNEKFMRYVINHPPSTVGKGEKAAFAGNKAAKKEGTSSKEKSKTSKTKKESKKKDDDDDDEEEEADDGVVWFSDTSAEAARKRQEEMVPKALEEKQIESEVEEIAKAIKDSTPENAADKITKARSALGLNDKVFLARLLTALFGSATDLQAEIKANLHILKVFFKSPENQFELLRYLETLTGTQNTALATRLALALKDLYDEDVVEEETFIKWDSEEVNPLVKEKSAPFLKWLKEAEEEDSEEEDDEEEEDE